MAAGIWPPSSAIQPRLCLIDIYRRSRDFAMAATAAETLAREPLDESSGAILAFQRRLIGGQDAGRQLMSSALRPPATRPHVSYQQARPAIGGSLWRRLFGRS
jgi:hypothetical protein